MRGWSIDTQPDVEFFDASTRRPDWSLYAVSKRLQEEMCEQYHAAHGLQFVMLRPDHIVDSRSGWNRSAPLTSSAVLDTQGETGWVCRHDLASACVLAAEKTGLGAENHSNLSLTFF
jgi:nucleoside-diphosphate-sugar epimerase